MHKRHLFDQILARFTELPRLRFRCHSVQEVSSPFALRTLDYFKRTALLVPSGILHREYKIGTLLGQLVEQLSLLYTFLSWSASMEAQFRPLTTLQLPCNLKQLSAKKKLA
jgi:hypothetical protein